MTSVALAVMGYRDNVSYILESIRICKDYVDQIEILGPTDNDAFTDKQRTQLLDAMGSVSGGVSGYPWHDDFSEYKNALLVPIQTDWVAIFDADEIPSPELAANLKILISKAKSQGANLVYLKAINITHERDGKQTMHLSDGKPNLHENIPNPYYGNVHIWLKPGYFPWKSLHSRYAYYHCKTWEENYTRAIRNVFMGGGGDTVKDNDPFGYHHWSKVRAIAQKDGIKNYKDLLVRIREGTISQELRAWMQWVHNLKWHDGELRAWKEYWNQIHENDKL